MRCSKSGYLLIPDQPTLNLSAVLAVTRIK